MDLKPAILALAAAGATLAWPLAARADGPAQVSAGYIGEVFSVLDGGVDRGAVYTGLGWLAVDGGAGEWHWHANAYAPHGRSLSERYLGDLAVASNIDTASDARLQELWLEWRSGPWALRAGMLAADTEFWGSDYAATFINSAFGAPAGISANLPNPPIFPTAAAGVRLAYALGDGATARLALVDGDSGDLLIDNPRGFDVSLAGDKLLLAEYEQTSDRGDDAVPDRWRVAAWHHGGAFADAGGHDRGASWGGMVAVDHALTDELGWFGRISLSRSATSLAPLALETGINLALPAQLPGTLGFGVAWLKLDRDLAAAADIANADHETALEATWSIPLGTSWHVQPDLQYILQPGGTAAADDALVLGLRVVWQSDW